jgi:threonine synthase
MMCLPVGNAGNITAYWKGFSEYKQRGIVATAPEMMGFQAAGAAPIVLGHPVDKPETIATAIRIGNPASWRQAEAVRDESGGGIDMVTDDEILAAYHLMAEKGGIFGEPASAASLAGLLKMKRGGYEFSEKTVVCVVTGSGLKDADTAIKGFSGKFIEVTAELPAMERALGF